jgi:hypothetical protein
MHNNDTVRATVGLARREIFSGPPICVPGVALLIGEYNDDGIVDAADYLPRVLARWNSTLDPSLKCTLSSSL